MVETAGLKTRSGFTFTTDAAGPAGGPLVLLLHGFPESRHSWRAALPALAAAGYRAVASDQRGYSPGARPDPCAFRRALLKEDGDQKHRSRHHRAFLDPGTGKLLLEENARRLREGLFGQGVPQAALEEHLSVLGNPEALEAALAWYRSNKGLAADIGTIKVPTLYIWGDADATVGPDAAYGTGEFVSAAYTMEVLPSVGHFVMDQAPAKATDLML